MSDVLFASAKMAELKADASLPAKYSRLLDKLALHNMFKDKSVAIKMHLGGNLGYTTIPPLFVKLLVQKIREAGGRPFITDGGNAVPTAKDRGYTLEVLEAPIVPAQGITGEYFFKVPIDYLTLREINLCGEIVKADAMVVLSHGKGHGHCGWGGAIKNIAMGTVSYETRGAIHALIDTEFDWDGELCTHCYNCKDNCPSNAISFRDDKLHIVLHHCKYCMHCVSCCPQSAIKINEEGIRQFQTGMAKVTKACLDTFAPDSVLYINHILSITPFCDCWGFSSPAIVPDIGITAGKDIVAVEKASIDMIKTEDYIPGSLPPPLEIRDVAGHLLQKIHGKDPYLQVEEAAAAGLGEQQYDIIQVD